MDNDQLKSSGATCRAKGHLQSGMPKESAAESLAAAAGHSVSIRRSWVRPGRAPSFRTPLMVLGIGILGYVIWMSSSKPPRAKDLTAQNPMAAFFENKEKGPAAADKAGPAVPKPAEKPAPSPVPVELTPPKSRPTVGPSGKHIERSAGTTVQWADKLDPSRLAGEFGYESLEPLEAKRYLVASPHAWMFLKDGWSIYIKSDTGRMYIPDEQATRRPESGTLRGNVVIKAFKARLDGSRPDPAKDAAYLTAETDSLAFDGSIGEISTVDRLTAKWEQGYFAGRGLTAVYNELRSRLESVVVNEGEELILNPSAKEGAVAGAPAPKPVTTEPPTAPVKSTAAASGPTAPVVQEQTFYHGTFGAEVRITQDKRVLTSDQLELWAKLVDGKFAPGAAATKPVAKGDGGKKAEVVPGGSPPAVATTDAVAPVQVAEKTAPGPIRLTWSGPFEMRTSDTKFAQLDNDSLAMRFSSAKSGSVKAVDTAIGAEAVCNTADYFATRRQIRLEGPGADGVVVTSGESGTVRGSVLTADMASGSATVVGAGKLEGANTVAMDLAAKSDQDTRSSVVWTQQAQFVFDQSGAAARIKEAIFTGDVVAGDGTSMLKGSFVRGEFTQQQNQPSLLSKLTVQDKAMATDGAGGEISADHLYATFVPAAHLSGEKSKSLKPMIERLQGRGNVYAHQAKDEIHAGSLDAKFLTDGEKPGKIATIVARDEVRIDSDDLHASAAELKADFATQIVDLVGSEGTHAVASRGQTTISGQMLKMDGIGRTLDATGRGTLSHVDTAKVEGAAASKIDASWKESMNFDDRLGTAKIRGEVVAYWMPDAVSLDILKSKSLDLAFTPFVEPVKAVEGAAAPANPVPEAARALLSAVAIGSEAERATFESRRFDPADKEPIENRKPQRVHYLEGDRIVADNARGTLDVPGAGKLLVSDRRATEGKSSGSFAGDALFHWQTSLNVRREAGIADMVGKVEVIHQRPGDSDPTQMHCDQITASMRQPAPAAVPEGSPKRNELSMQGEVTRILATGHVWARSATKREVNSDVMDYDAIAGMIFLTSRDGSEVQAFDPASGTPIRGKSLEWDLKLDRIRLRDAGGISVPR